MLIQKRNLQEEIVKYQVNYPSQYIIGRRLIWIQNIVKMDELHYCVIIRCRDKTMSLSSI